jgi:hypothetical protein
MTVRLVFNHNPARLDAALEILLEAGREEATA